jgi:transaldolase / glucose-6-phosphate isomerase
MTTKVANPIDLSLLPIDLAARVASGLDELTAQKFAERLFARDQSLWTSQGENEWLDWLNGPESQLAQADDYEAFSAQILDAGFKHVLLLGMGGSSLAPEVFALTMGSAPGYPELSILDSTDPAQVKAADQKIDIAKTLFVVASKSGSTLEPSIFMSYFLERARQVLGAKATEHFVAITDPGSKLEAFAKEQKFARIFSGHPAIGGRYSALSPFGIVPLALIGANIKGFLSEAASMMHLCQEPRAASNPGLQLGTVMGLCQTSGRDKITLVTSPEIFDFGAWLEQLIAESTGKSGKAIIPVDLETLSSDPHDYGDDRLFVFIRLEEGDKGQNAKIAETLALLAEAGQPVVTISVPDKTSLGQEFYRFEIATACAGSFMKINPFDQPDVEASKIVTKELTAAYQQSGSLPAESPITVGKNQYADLSFYTDAKNKNALKAQMDTDAVVLMKSHLDRLKAGDYFALLAYLQMDREHQQVLQAIRQDVFAAKKVATCLGFGPRFLHSTGQAYKGGPNSGVFLQITCDDALDVAVPGQKYTFSIVKAAQARGDFQVLIDRDRRALRVHLKGDLKKALQSLSDLVKKALS